MHWLLRRGKINRNKVHLRPFLAYINTESSIVHKCNSRDVFSVSFISDSVPYGSPCTRIIGSLHPETDRESNEIWQISYVDMSIVIFNEVQLVVTVLHKAYRKITPRLSPFARVLFIIFPIHSEARSRCIQYIKTYRMRSSFQLQISFYAVEHYSK